MSKEWTRKPSVTSKTILTNADELEQQAEALIKDYLEDYPDKKVVCLVDGTNAVYLLVFEKNGEEKLEQSDVALLNPKTNTYEFLPKEVAEPIAHAYIEHISAIAEGYRYLDKKGD